MRHKRVRCSTTPLRHAICRVPERVEKRLPVWYAMSRGAILRVAYWFLLEASGRMAFMVPFWWHTLRCWMSEWAECVGRKGDPLLWRRAGFVPSKALQRPSRDGINILISFFLIFNFSSSPPQNEAADDGKLFRSCTKRTGFLSHGYGWTTESINSVNCKSTIM